ncbi:sugar porter family MFS transporter [Staphylococcus shinii]|uniref:Sugar porter family MFS transporter n=2 Tax=Staphylococcus TaxID=1279 RepID=A0A418IJ08_9STAP|nr:sugar porter family MFS transporter [Staphylococcus shinii]MDW8563702.1 sugar porter family MFS transporter [Staphylococcus shinii]MDW8566942.1 sugar porter family MFS transporter [Staphylococcus shinii]RIN02951.1 sugar porter family MFS transporter [Staphylococcus shinii]RIN04730.1 sugar porter family MFS transporter [Staphylococcus shinii]
MDISEVDKKNNKMKKITLIATFGGLLFGFDTGVINGALPYMSMANQLDLTPATEGLVSSSLVFGAAFGAITGGRLSDSFGRRKMILVLAIIFFIATLGCGLSPNIYYMVTFRVILGLAVGGASVIVPTFLSEMSSKEKRGRMVTQNELMIVSGQLMAYVINGVLGNLVDNPGVWRVMLLVATIPAIILWFGMLKVPESPRWYASRSKYWPAYTILRTIRDEKTAAEEVKEIKTIIDKEKLIKNESSNEFSKPWVRKILFIGIGIGIVQQITGVNSIMYYGTEILRNAGFATKAALIGNIANGVISVLATFVGIWLLGRVGRRPMLLTGQLGIIFTLILLSIMPVILEGTFILPFVILLLTVTFLGFMQGSIAPVTWLMLSEIFPLKIRGIGMGASVFFCWMTNFLVSLIFPVLLGHIGLSLTFVLFVVLNIIAFTFVKKFLPETKGKSLEEIESYFKGSANENKRLNNNVVKEQ